MPKSLREEIEAAAHAFAETLLQAFASVPLGALIAETGAGERRGRSGASEAPSAAPPRKRAAKGGATGVARAAKGAKRARRRRGVDEALLEKMLATLRGKADGLRAEQLRAQLGVSKEALAPVVKAALANKQVTKKGEKRLTTYFAK